MGRNRMKGKILAIVFAIMLVNGVFANRAFAQEIKDPENLRYDRNGIVQVSDEFSNEKVNEKVQRAKELGLNVEVKQEETELLYAHDAVEKVKEIEDLNRETIKKLEEAIADQEKKNDEYKRKQEESFSKVIGQEWTKEQLEELLLGHKKATDGTDEKELIDKYSSVSVITKQKIRDAEHPFGFEGKSGGSVELNTGDTWKYKNVFQDSLTGEWIDVAFKVLEIKDTNSDNEKDNIVTRTRASVSSTVMSMELKEHAKIQLSFFKSGTNELVELEPMLIFADVDANQGVTIESKDNVKCPYLKGKNLRVAEDLQNEANYDSEKVLYEKTLRGKKDLGGGLIFEKNSRDFSPLERVHWAIFKLPKTGQVTYWFYGGYGRTDGVLHEVGGSAIAYDRPEKEYNREKVKVSLKEIKIYHKVAYEYVGRVPEGQVPPVDDNKYFLHQELELANDPTTTVDNRDGHKGKWSFKGWYTDRELTSKVEKHSVMKDEVLYGAWEFVPEQKLIHGKIEVLKVDAADESKLLAGAEFELRQGKKVVEKGVTDKDGKLVFKDVAYGEYEVYETKAPEGYLIEKESLKAKVEEEGKTIQLTFKDKPEEKAPTPVQKGKKGTPKTGDFNRLTWYSLMAGAALVLLVGANRKKKWLGIQKENEK